MIIGFTGHRDKPAKAEKLLEIHELHPGATWVHGGAAGFDSSVEEYANSAGIKTEVHSPDYQKHGRGATFIRNRLIVDSADMIVTNHDGRKTGGTAYTVAYAKKKGKKVYLCG